MFEDEEETDDLFFLQSPTECLSSSSSMSAHHHKTNKRNNKRRFSDDQIRTMEIMFESETKLEPAKKLQLAKELGLQPRQIAIWFQNRRARWKTKQLHKEYTILHNNYNHLASQFDLLKKEKQSLLFQIQHLSEELLQKKSGVVLKEETEKAGNETRNEKLSENGVGGGFLSDDNYFGWQNEDGDKCLLEQCCGSYQWWDV